MAEIYGYTTTRFNEQVNNNIEKFEGEDFCFYLTQDEFKNLISKKSISSWGGRRKPPRAFTESGLYMLMTVLRGDLATKQINTRVKQSDISPILLTFETHIDNGEYLLREGHPAKADETYMDIYGKADKSVYIVDNYIDIKTLRLLQTVKNGVTVKIFSDNVGNHLHIHDKNDFNPALVLR